MKDLRSVSQQKAFRIRRRRGNYEHSPETHFGAEIVRALTEKSRMDDNETVEIWVFDSRLRLQMTNHPDLEDSSRGLGDLESNSPLIWAYVGEYRPLLDQARNLGRPWHRIQHRFDALGRHGSSLIRVFPVFKKRDRVAHVVLLKQSRVSFRDKHVQFGSLATTPAFVFHDLKNLFTTILGFSELLGIDACGKKECLKYLEEIQKATNHATDLLSRHQLATLGIPAEKAPLSLGELVQEIAPLLGAGETGGVRVETRILTSQDCIWGDRLELKQALINLGMNSVEALRGLQGTLIIRLSRIASVIESDSRKGDWIVLAVQDQGPGLPLAFHHNLCNPFLTTRRGNGGTGLGLAIVNAAVIANQGIMNVESASGEGTKFELCFPAYSLEGEENALNPGLIR